MRIHPIKLENQNKLISDYRLEKEEIMDFFDYIPSGDLEGRVKDLHERIFQRESLQEVLHKLNKGWDAPNSTLHNIDRFSNEDSVVVIAGQQAGLLTGPMYTINKVISVLQLAKQQEEKLNIPVIPVFWIAGEDHDFDEINHIFMQEKSRLRKLKVGQENINKSSVSEIQLEKNIIRDWLDKVFSYLEETENTKDLYHSILLCLEQSETYTDFFARLIFKLFPDEGLVLIDSHHPLVRNLEKEYFEQMILKQREISSGVNEILNKLRKNDYQVPLEADLNSGNLFYHHNKERILLYRNENGGWNGKQGEVELTTKELITIANNQPEKLSNNVVTRPLMQELLFPSLAFIGGPGEISYWSALKPVFHVFGIKMPPIFPRLSFTYIESKVSKLMGRLTITTEEVVNNGIQDYKRNWINSKTKPPIHELAVEMKETIEKAHKPLRDLAKEIRADIGDLADKNLYYLQKEISFIEGRMVKAIEEKYNKELTEMDLIKVNLYPDGLQERIWNPLPFINKFGADFIKKTIDNPYSFSNDHYLVYL
ncbi:bacillithiol biosynthesis cysteine-adding enzyme BshC [Oceanobacillus sp. Castelsardo]|uniref:bacillithiol biosynthesis cysteine-adding enzyme BshC n=1 Tax=Oceanobacillus sp. Castelsardo TaxID=1851204 RepID=UPI0008395354|nr:bacillithiol biosynthesis cysteine-adding enzyme BshC [Oceanobacillus sp. Castelsardo]